jgi:hypothetical protein
MMPLRSLNPVSSPVEKSYWLLAVWTAAPGVGGGLLNQTRNPLLISSFIPYQLYLFYKADKDLTQPPPLHHLRIYLHTENGTVNKVHRWSSKSRRISQRVLSNALIAS